MEAIPPVGTAEIGAIHTIYLLATLLGLLAGILYSFGGFLYELATNSLNTGTALAFFALVGMPAIFGACGFALGLVEALLFNIFARWFGGFETDFGPGP